MATSPEFVILNNTEPTGNGDTHLIAINVGSQLPLKLTPSNFPSWRAQLMSLLIGYDLQGYLDGTIAFSKPVMPLIAASSTARDAWSKLQRLYANRSQSRSVSEYLHAIKVLVDELAIIDSPVSANDITLYVLNGLGPEFRDIAAPIRARETSLTFEELHDMLVGQENYLERIEAFNSSLVATANSTQRCSAVSKSNRNQRFNTSSSGQQRTNSSPYGRKERSGKPQIVCQLCDKVGHSAKTCRSAFTEKSVNRATTSGSNDKKWLVDLAASHIITSDPANLSVHSKYDGTDEVVIGDGSGLRVTHDRSTGATLLRGKCKDGVYPMPLASLTTKSSVLALV
ncbi:hypothetical protein F2P56_024420, partial [Juglans regia]